jgi:hypothetical protein
MALHVSTKLAPASQRFRAVRVVAVGRDCEVAFGFAFPSWPRLAFRLQQRGYRVETVFLKGRPALRTSASAEDIKALLSSRAKRTRPLKLLVVTLCVVAIAFVMLFSPASRPQPVQQKLVEKPNRCSEQVIDRALTSDELPSYLAHTQVLKIGGVVTGEIACDGQRYSYTLDQGKTKRVLKLQKLDS